jgi:hypothetical protein
MSFVLFGLAVACTVLTTLMALTFCMGMGANATAAQIRAIKRWMAGLGLLGVAGIAAGFALMLSGAPGWASVAALAPTVVFALILFIALAMPRT